MYPTGLWIPIEELLKLDNGKQIQILLGHKDWAIYFPGIFTQTGDGLYPAVEYTSGLAIYDYKDDRYYCVPQSERPTHFMVIPELKR